MNSRNQSLDVLRGIAVLMVVLWHYALLTNHASKLSQVGITGVDLFFVLSGFLISGLLFTEYKSTGAISLKRFWIRRGFKIYPPFYAFMGTSLIAFLLLAHRVPKAMLYELTFTQNYLGRIWPHTWSLAVEEHFYFLLPILLVLLAWAGRGKANPFRAVPAISIGVSVACLYFRILAMKHGGDWDHLALPTHIRIDALFAGVALGYIYHFDSDSFCEAKRWYVIAVGILFSASLLILPDLPRISFAYIAFAFIVAWAANQKKNQSRPLRALAWIGLYSYSIYLWHGFALAAVPYIPIGWYRLPIYLAIVFALGVGLSKLIEIPALKVRDRFFPSGSKEYGSLGIMSAENQAANSTPACSAVPMRSTVISE